MKKIVGLLFTLLLIACDERKEDLKIKITDQGTGADKTMDLIEKRKQMEFEEEQRAYEEGKKQLEHIMKAMEYEQ